MSRANFLKFTYIITTCLFLVTTATPALAMTDMNGQSIHLQNMVGKGKWSVAKIWAHDCHACQQSIHYLSEFEQQFMDAEVFGISIDGQSGKQQALQFIDKFNLSFPNLLSDAREIDDYLYEQVGETLIGTPTLIVFNPQGKIVAVQPGAVKPDDLIRFIRQQQADPITKQ